jgi:butyryl-CoA dehydrogenase
MDFDLTEEQLLVQETAREFADRYLAPAAARLDLEERFPPEHWKELAALGFLGFLIPSEHGGAGLDNLTQSLALEEINRACASTGVAVSVHNSLVSAPIVRFGREEQKALYLPRMASGELIGAYALSEPGHGSDAAALETTATRKGERYVIEGRKAWITNGLSAGLVLTFATVDRSRSHRGITAFLVESSLPGFATGKKEKKLGIRGSETVELIFDGVEVPESARLGGEGEGFRIALETLDGGRIGIAAQAAGIIAASLAASTRYAEERRQFGRPIGEFQPIQWKLAEMAASLEASRLLIRRAAWLRDRDRPHRVAASMAKLYASEAANRAADDAVQIHGGAGYCKDFPVERYYRDAKVTEIYEGTSEIQRIVIARSLLRGLDK